MKTQTKLTLKNASTVSTIINIKNPEWGVQRFNFKSEPLNDGTYTHSFGIGANSSVLSEREFKFWAVVSYK